MSKKNLVKSFNGDVIALVKAALRAAESGDMERAEFWAVRAVEAAKKARAVGARL